MCGPPALALAAAGLAAAGTMAGAISQSHQMRYQARIADRNAALENERARDAIDRGKIQNQQLARKYSAIQGEQRVAMAANGLDVDFGSAAQVAGDTQMFYAEDRSALYKNQYDELRGFDINVSNYRGEARAKRSAAKGALVQGAFQAAGSLLGGAQQYKSLKAQ